LQSRSFPGFQKHVQKLLWYVVWD